MAGVDPGAASARRTSARRAASRAARVFTKCFLALLGQWPWQRIPPIPVEIVLLPPSAPFSVYNFACWARQTIVAALGRQALRPVRPADVDLREIGARPGETRRRARPGAIRRRALREAEQWVRDRQEADGSWGGIQPPWVWSIVMLAALGHGFEDETLRRAVEGWGGFTIDEGDRLRPEACQSPVWDTALAVLALRDCGRPRRAPAARARRRVAARPRRSTVKGDWAVRRPELAPGGWAFEFENDLYPDVDDTAVVALALRELGIGERRGASAASTGWSACSRANGGWGAFDVDNTRVWLYRIPFCDFGAVIDPPSEDVTAHALEALAPDRGLRRRGRDAALDYLLGEQQGDGSWCGRWGVNHVYGTGAALPALEACGHRPGHPAVRRAVAWLDSVQDEDGGFGEDIRSLPRAELARPRRPDRFTNRLGAISLRRCRQAPGGGREAGGGVSLRRRSSTNGDWDEQHYTGTGFPDRLHDPLPPLPTPLPAHGPRPSTRKADRMKFPLRIDGPDRPLRRAAAAQGRALPARAHARADARVQHRLHRLREDPRVRVEPGAAVGRGVHRRGRAVPGAGRLDLRRRAARLQGDRGRRRRHARAAQEHRALHERAPARASSSTSSSPTRG